MIASNFVAVYYS